MRCTLHSLSITPPLDSAVSLELPLAILWKQDCHFYGSFNVTIAYREEMENGRSLEGIRSQLFLYDDSCYVSIPNLLKGNGQFIILFKFVLQSLKMERSRIETTRALLFNTSQNDSFCIM